MKKGQDKKGGRGGNAGRRKCINSDYCYLA